MREVDNASSLRHEAAALLERADRCVSPPDREQLLVWAQELTEKADELEMAEARYAHKQ
jgi:hypothetical protein